MSWDMSSSSIRQRWGTECSLTGGESFDHNHRTAAEWTDPHRNGLGRSRFARGRGSRTGIGQELFAERHKFTAVATGQEAVMADAHEAARQHMQEESTQELIDRKRHEPFFVLVGGVSPTKSNLVVDK